MVKKYLPAISAWAGWVIARLLLLFWSKLDTGAAGDVAYYFNGVFGDRDQDMREYPDVGAWPTLVVSWFSGEDLSSYISDYMIMCLLVDGAFLALLLRHHDQNRKALIAAWFWIIFGTAVGPVLLLRLDIFPALAVAGAGALLIARPNLASALLALATAMKLWPGVLAVSLVGRATSASTWLRLLGFAATGIGLSAITVLTQGFDRLISPLNYQGERGLQIESVPATVAIWQAHLSPEQYTIGYAASKSFEITGPGVDTAMAVSTVAMAIVLGFAVCFALYRFCVGGWTPRSAQALCVLLIIALIASNKVFSPQYILWLGPLLAVLLRQPPLPRGEKYYSRRLHRGIAWFKGSLALFAIVAAGLGTYIYPFNYEEITALGHGMNVVVLCLVVRNVLILLMTLCAIAWFLCELRAARRLRVSVPRSRFQRLGS